MLIVCQWHMTRYAKVLDADDIPVRICTFVSKVSDTSADVIRDDTSSRLGEAIVSPMVTK